MASTPQNQTASTTRPSRRLKFGLVTSDKRDKTRTVVVSYQSRHPKYGKYIRRGSAYQVHDPANASKVGDQVEIATCRPISKTKSWKLVRVVESATADVAG